MECFKTFYITLGYKDENAIEMANNFEMNDKVSACTLNTCKLKPKQNSENTIYHHKLFIRKQERWKISYVFYRRKTGKSHKYNVS